MKILIHIAAATLVLIVLDHCVFLHANAAIDTSELPCNSTCLYTTSFQYADCRSRGLSSIPPQCSSSVYLDFRQNDLQYLNRAFFDGYATLRYLYLENNTIRNITPGAFTACQALREIFLQHNPLVTIDAQTFNGLIALRHLYLNYANLEVIEANAFVGLPSLERLFLSDNALRTLPQQVFKDLRTLKILILSNNRLRYLHREQFQGLGQLRILDIQHNQISRLEEGLFRGLPSLQALNLSNNAISEVQNGALDFATLVNLEQLDMCHNNILVTSNFSDHLVDIRDVFFAGNPMHCGCGNKVLMKWYKQLILNGSSLIADSKVNVICHGPEDLVDIPMKNIADDVMVSCTKQRSNANAAFQNNDQIPDEISPEIESTTRTEGIDLMNNGGQVQATGVQRKGSGANTQQEGNMYMFIGIAALLLCGAVVVFIATILYARYKRSNENRRREQKAQENEKQQTPLRITENPVPEKHEEEDDDVYEPIADIPDFPSRRRRLVSEKSTDSAYWEDYPDSEDLPPPSHPPPPPPIGKSMPLQESGYIPVFQNQNGRVYLCTQCPHMTPTGQPILMHSVSVPSHCADLPHYRPHSQSQPLMPRQQNPFPEGYQSHCVPSSTQSPHQQVEALPSYAHPMKCQMSDPNFQAQNQMLYTQTNNHQQGQMQDSPPIPLQTDIASYSQLEMMTCYPNTNPFASSQMVRSNPNPTQPRRVSFSNVTTVHNNPVFT